MLQYIPNLEAQGFEITVRSFFGDEHLGMLYKEGKRPIFRIAKLYLRRLIVLLSARNYDVIWIEKEIFPYLPAFAERMLSFLGRSYVVDYDDAVFHNYDLSPNFLVRRLLGKKIDAVMHNAECVVVGNRYLASRAEQAGARQIMVVPTVIDQNRYVPVCETKRECPVIGWIGSPFTQKYLISIRDVLKQACRDYHARLLFVGANQKIVEEFQEDNVEVVAWEEDTESQMIARMDIGIMPLYDDAWEKGKCGYKLIQYMACGVPLIASPIGVNVDIVSGSKSGFLAMTDEDWKESLGRLLKSRELRSSFGTAGRHAVLSTYCIQAQAPTIVDILTRCAHKIV